MKLDISQLRRLQTLVIDGVKLRNVLGFEIRRSGIGDELVITIKIGKDEFVEIA